MLLVNDNIISQVLSEKVKNRESFVTQATGLTKMFSIAKRQKKKNNKQLQQKKLPKMTRAEQARRKP